mgnify:CR=1 FL=1
MVICMDVKNHSATELSNRVKFGMCSSCEVVTPVQGTCPLCSHGLIPYISPDVPVRLEPSLREWVSEEIDLEIMRDYVVSGILDLQCDKLVFLSYLLHSSAEVKDPKGKEDVRYLVLSPHSVDVKTLISSMCLPLLSFQGKENQ